MKKIGLLFGMEQSFPPAHAFSDVIPDGPQGRDPEGRPLDPPPAHACAWAGSMRNE